MMSEASKYRAIAIGASAGGVHAVPKLFNGIHKDICLPVIIVQHRFKGESRLLEENLQKKIAVKVKQADEKEDIIEGQVYIAPPDYHLLVERNKTFSLTSGPLVNFSRPSIDVLFETASEVYQEGLVSIILTGANRDGANGIRSVSRFGGLTIAQDPREALFPTMPDAAIQMGVVKKVLTLSEINKFMREITKYDGRKEL